MAFGGNIKIVSVLKSQLMIRNYLYVTVQCPQIVCCSGISFFLFFNLLSYLPSSYLSSRVGWVAHNEVPLLGPKGQWLMLM